VVVWPAEVSARTAGTAGSAEVAALWRTTWTAGSAEVALRGTIWPVLLRWTVGAAEVTLRRAAGPALLRRSARTTGAALSLWRRDTCRCGAGDA
jgi:hypothetical protein